MPYGYRISAGVKSYNRNELDRLLEAEDRARTETLRPLGSLRGLPADQQRLATGAREGRDAASTNRLRASAASASGALGEIRGRERRYPGRRLGGGGSTGLAQTDAMGYGEMLAEQKYAVDLDRVLGGRQPTTSRVDTRVFSRGGSNMPGYWEDRQEREQGRRTALAGQGESLKIGRAQTRATTALAGFRESQTRGFNQRNRMESDPVYRAMQRRADVGMDTEREIEEARSYIGTAPGRQVVADEQLPSIARRQQEATALEQTDARYYLPQELRSGSSVERAQISAGGKVQAAGIAGQARTGAAAISGYARVAAADFPVPGSEPGAEDSLMTPYLEQLERHLPDGSGSFIDVRELMEMLAETGDDPEMIAQQLQVYGIELR
ncbi:MAG: hypothetical protein IIA90_07675 [Chloroflexi bacterium]|nr:hypothetical protein [Chloroflexota bacterium]